MIITAKLFGGCLGPIFVKKVGGCRCFYGVYLHLKRNLSSLPDPCSMNVRALEVSLLRLYSEKPRNPSGLGAHSLCTPYGSGFRVWELPDINCKAFSQMPSGTPRSTGPQGRAGSVMRTPCCLPALCVSREASKGKDLPNRPTI